MDSLQAPCPRCELFHEPGSCPPASSMDDGLFASDLTEATPGVCACGSTYLAAPGIDGCPLCTKESLFKRALWLNTLEQRLRVALADATGQKDSLLRYLKSHEYTPPPSPVETHRCVRCDGWLHLGYVIDETGLYVCQPCAVIYGLLAWLPIRRSEWCRHRYPTQMCELCTYQFRERMRAAARNLAPKIQRDIVRIEATKAPDATVEEI